MSNLYPLNLCGEKVFLTPDGFFYWPQQNLLAFADAHFGKGASFARMGVALGDLAMKDDLERISSFVTKYSVRKIFILGDLIHSRDSLSDHVLRAFGDWVESIGSVQISLIKGNHDERVAKFPDEWRLGNILSECSEGPFTFIHHHMKVSNLFVISGHLHPSVELRSPIGASARLPCFWLRPKNLILPAFGALTGTSSIVAEKEDRVFCVAHKEIHEVFSKIF